MSVAPSPPPDGTRTPGRLFRVALGRRRREVVRGTLLTCVHQASETAVPILVGVFVDAAIVPGDTGRLALWLAILVATFTALAVGGMWATTCSTGPSCASPTTCGWRS